MTQLSKERIEQYAFNDRMCNVNDEIREMARRLLAVEGQEPVAWRWRQNETKPWHLTVRSDCAGEVQPLYSAPQPAPVAQPVQVPDEVTYAQAENISGWESCSDAWADGWNACRAAMLNADGALINEGTKPVTAEAWIAEAKNLAEMHGTSFVVFRNGEEPQCADPRKVVISFTDEGLGYPSAPQEPTK